MSGRLAAEIKQSKPFARPEEEAFLNIAKTFELLDQKLTDFLRPFELSPTQYNVLRILRGAGNGGVTCSQAAERMVNHDPDMTRLLDRLEARGLVTRDRGQQDRRLVITRITAKGKKILRSIDEPIARFHKDRLGHLGTPKLRLLIGLLEQIR